MTSDTPLTHPLSGGIRRMTPDKGVRGSFVGNGRLSDEAKAELQRPRPATEKELEELLRQLLDLLVECVGSTIADRSGRYTEQLKREAAEKTYDYYVFRLMTNWRADGTVIPWLAHRNVFFHKFKRTIRDLNRHNTTLRGVRKHGQDKPKPVSRFIPMDAAEAPDIIVSRVHGDRWRAPESTEAQALTPLALELIPRIVSVLGTRTGDSGLSEKHAQLARILMHLELGAGSLAEDDVRLLWSFTDIRVWRSQVAQAWHERALADEQPSTGNGKRPRALTKPNQSEVNEGTKRVLQLIKTCLYLFITLAPPQRAVARPETMHQLLDLVFHSNKSLTTQQRKLLQHAGKNLQPGAWQFRVHKDEFVSSARTLAAFRTSTEDELLEDLHQAEAAFAPHVPGQRTPPRFRCVLECSDHLPQPPKGHIDD